MQRLTATTSTVFISLGGETRVFRSVAEVPAPLRRKLQASTQGANSATILIADEGGRKELARALDGRSDSVKCRLLESVTRKNKPAPRRFPLSFRACLELLFPLVIGASLWLLID